MRGIWASSQEESKKNIQNKRDIISAREHQPPLSFPDGWDFEKILNVFLSFSIDGSAAGELAPYAQQDCERFIYTWGLLDGLHGNVLEIGANPYFTTLLIKKFTNLIPTLTNYFGPVSEINKDSCQILTYMDPETGHSTEYMRYINLNIEEQKFPFENESFDVVLFCEVLEHLLMDPLACLREISRVLKPNGRLILTTPNVARLENIARMIQGSNIYDPYSGYGPYGRHNREYNRHEIVQMLNYVGFEPEIIYTADVHEHAAYNFVSPQTISTALDGRQDRKNDLGQYIFSRSIKRQKPQEKKPRWLYRSYPDGELE